LTEPWRRHPRSGTVGWREVGLLGELGDRGERGARLSLNKCLGSGEFSPVNAGEAGVNTESEMARDAEDVHAILEDVVDQGKDVLAESN
jgi:hypothetical protein